MKHCAMIHILLKLILYKRDWLDRARGSIFSEKEKSERGEKDNRRREREIEKDKKKVCLKEKKNSILLKKLTKNTILNKTSDASCFKNLKR